MTTGLRSWLDEKPVAGQTDSFEPDLTGKSLLGPKALFLSAEAFRNQEPLIPGHLVSLNEKDKLFSSRIICVPTDINHSRNAHIGTFSLSKAQDELGRFTVFGESRSHGISASRREMLWETVCRMLKPTSENRVELCLSYGDFDP
jgi:hypothetical protein